MRSAGSSCPPTSLHTISQGHTPAPAALNHNDRHHHNS
uniref:Uncharacterized protein n=1 Tax=Caudovirales sp. ctMVT27 TaxID=2826771 RepID=A0A8S5M2N0_9CAUD|nr:MAG TPA: hypothetical protein [Caudovirales sp. ctMVT27]